MLGGGGGNDTLITLSSALTNGDLAASVPCCICFLVGGPEASSSLLHPLTYTSYLSELPAAVTRCFAFLLFINPTFPQHFCRQLLSVTLITQPAVLPASLNLSSVLTVCAGCNQGGCQHCTL